MKPSYSLLRPLLNNSAPLTGEASVSGLHAPVRIRRDGFSIPYIEAESEADAWFGLGFCQAQDRAFQLELRLRLVRGTLSALFGERTLSIDRLSRRIGFYEASVRQLAVLHADIRDQIEAFVRGINAGLEIGRRPLEFLLLRSRPTQWGAADVVGIAKLMSFVLIGNWDVELARLKILMSDGEQALRDLDPTYPVDHPVVSPPGEAAGQAVDRLSQDLTAMLALAGSSGGSNAWAVSGERTKSGRPILASDPHLEPFLPPHWYLAHLKAPAMEIVGAALAGSPAIGIGHNGFAAWGLTAGLIDKVDLFLEEVGTDGRSVRRGDGFEPCQVRREVIDVRGKSSVVEDVLVTPRGPVIGPVLTDAPSGISMRAVWLDAKPARGFLRAPHARSFQEFRAEFANWPVADSNVVYADAEGHIAWQLVGETPQRRKGWGTLPLSGADPETGWHEAMVPFDEMPFVIDPAQGFVVSANNKPTRDGEDRPFLGVDWLDGYRAGRITEMLEERADWDVASTQRLHVDVKTLAWQEVRKPILRIKSASSDAQAGLGLLAAWDGELSADSVAATVFELFLADMWVRVAKVRAPNSWQFAMGRGFSDVISITTFAAGRPSRFLKLLGEQPAGWFDRPWGEEMADALASVVRDLTSKFGSEPEGWAWGEVRPLTLRHPLGQIPQLARIFDRGPFAWGGDGNTVSQAAATALAPLGNPTCIASLRMVVELGNWDEARFVLPGGQSGDPFSPHYDDQIPVWLRGDGVPIAWSPEAISKAAVNSLRLSPLRR